ncbi:S8 family serine peptidase [Anaeromicropila populeti]|uniref:Peptidase S8/S53 domain-containing protein n=1 Tax=Anaeromicropila populeti TaxID=37658 RepID=A0A1I6IDP1_9FIRM|nr:S8 family serine peptidase [Anaeromicropila populeti]SFR64739.1 hypothetical protein SAMN05661086_00724 [Anaeromicropila populeti]
MNKLKVAIVDDGVYASGVLSYSVTENNTVMQINHKQCISNHGTQCYNIYSSIAHNKQCISIKVGDYDSAGRLNSDKLLTALEWCCDNEMNLISLSLGTSYVNEFWKYEAVLNKLMDRKAVIVAAINNNNRLTYPAGKEGIIAVRYDKENELPPGKYAFLENELIGTNIVVNPVLKNLGDKTSQVASCNSFAVPYMAALISNAFTKETVSLENVQNWLKTTAYMTKEKFDNNYYKNLLSKNDFLNPIHICVIADERIRGLADWFNQNQYTAVELEINTCIKWKLMKRSVLKEDFKLLCEVICWTAQPDIIFWYTKPPYLEDEMAHFFDAVVLQNTDKADYDYSKLLCTDGVILSYKEMDICNERVAQDIEETFS